MLEIKMFEPLQPIVMFHPKSTKAKKQFHQFHQLFHCFFSFFFSNWTLELLLKSTETIVFIKPPASGAVFCCCFFTIHRPSALVKRAISLQQAQKKTRMIINSLVEVYKIKLEEVLLEGWSFLTYAPFEKLGYPTFYLSPSFPGQPGNDDSLLRIWTIAMAPKNSEILVESLCSASLHTDWIHSVPWLSHDMGEQQTSKMAPSSKWKKDMRNLRMGLFGHFGADLLRLTCHRTALWWHLGQMTTPFHYMFLGKKQQAANDGLVKKTALKAESLISGCEEATTCWARENLLWCLLSAFSCASAVLMNPKLSIQQSFGIWTRTNLCIVTSGMWWFDPCSQVVLSPNSNWLFSASGDIRLWNVPKMIRQMESFYQNSSRTRHCCAIAALTMQRDGLKALAVSSDQSEGKPNGGLQLSSWETWRKMIDTQDYDITIYIYIFYWNTVKHVKQ